MKLLQTKIVTIDGKEYPIKVTWGALIEFENISGHSYSKINDKISDIIDMFYCAIKAGGSDMTYDQFKELINDDPEMINEMVIVMQLVNEFFNAGLRKIEKKQIVL